MTLAIVESAWWLYGLMSVLVGVALIDAPREAPRRRREELRVDALERRLKGARQRLDDALTLQAVTAPGAVSAFRSLAPGLEPWDEPRPLCGRSSPSRPR